MNDAGFIVTTEIHPDYLRISAAGPYTSANAKHLVDRIVAEVEKHAAQRVLVDWRQMEGYPNTINRFQDGAYVAARITVKVALLVRAETMMGHFMETVAVNRGANFAAFDNEAEALAWLL